MLKIVKRKMFEPRKKIVYDTDGKQLLADSSTAWLADRQNLTAEELDMIEEGDGWNCADKDYVNYKIAELQQLIKNTAPTPIATATTTTNSTKSIFFSVGEESTEQSIVFFAPGLLLKKNWTILEFTIFSNIILEDDSTLSMKEVVDGGKLTTISKIKTHGKQLLSAESKHKISDVAKVVIFIIKFAKQPTVIPKISLQITVEH